MLQRYFLNCIIYTGVIAVLLAACLGCGKKGYLDRAPSDFIAEDQVFKDLANSEAFFNNAYNMIPNLFKPGGDGNWMLSSASDESEQVWDVPGDGNAFNNGSATPSSFPLSGYWTNFFNAIRRINIFLKNYDQIPVPEGEDPKRKERLLGEAHGLRAYFYFELYKMWGRVPLIETPLSAQDPGSYVLERASTDELVTFIKKEIELALPHLDPRNTSVRRNGIDISVCKALLARTLLYYASPLSNPSNDVSRWQAAVAANKEALDYAIAQGHTLNTATYTISSTVLPAYQNIFLDNATRVNEIIWGRQGDSGNWWETVTQSNRTASGLAGYYGTAPTVEMLDAYEMANGKPIDDPASGYNAQQPFANRDPRCAQTITGNGQSWRGVTIDVKPNGPDYKTDHPTTNLFLKKFMYPSNSYPTRLWILFRTAELYLNYAEAQNEVAGPDQTVYDAVNSIRNRAGMPPLLPGLSKDQMRERIRHERRIELAFEEHRFWDVRRWKIAEVTENRSIRKMAVSATNAVTYPVLESRSFTTPRDYLLPIPQPEYDRNPKIGQNPGW